MYSALKQIFTVAQSLKGAALRDRAEQVQSELIAWRCCQRAAGPLKPTKAKHLSCMVVYKLSRQTDRRCGAAETTHTYMSELTGLIGFKPSCKNPDFFSREVSDIRGKSGFDCFFEGNVNVFDLDQWRKLGSCCRVNPE